MEKPNLLIIFLLLFSTFFYGTPKGVAQSVYSATDSVISPNINASVSNWGRGMKFKPTQDIWVLQLGKRVPALGTYSWVIWDVASQTKVIEQNSLLDQPTQYIYEKIEAVVKLDSNKEYILELYGIGTAAYYYGPPTQTGPHIQYINMSYCGSCGPNDFPTLTLNGQHYGTPDFIYSLTPPISADNDAALSDFTTPSNVCAGNQDIKVIVENSGQNQIDSVKIAWTLDGVAQPTYSLSTMLDTLNGAGASQLEVTLGTHNFTSTPVSFKAWTFLPNNEIDTVNNNDTITASLQAAMGGIFTVDAALPATGTNFQSFTELSTALSTIGICGPVTVNVANGVYTEQVLFNDIPNASSVNTIRINGNGATVQFNNTTAASERQLLILDGAKYLTIDQLNFKTLATVGWGALITNGSAYDSIINCTFDLSSVTNSSSSYNNGIVFSGSNTSPTTLGNNGSYCYVGHNHIKSGNSSYGTNYGIVIYGTSDSNIIANNNIENTRYGIYVNGPTGLKLLNNEIHNTNKLSYFATFYGVYTAGNTFGLEVTGNRIHHPGGVNGYNSYNFYGIYSGGKGSITDSVLIANNAIYSTNLGTLQAGIYLINSYYNRIYHNTISLDEATAGSSATYGIYASNSNTGSEIKNNNVSITAGTSGDKFGFYYLSSSSISDGNSGKNNYYINSSQPGVQNYGYYAGTTYPSYNDFQTAGALYELGSFNLDPVFVNPANSDFNVQSLGLIGSGEELGSIVSTDINEIPRPVKPTIGAFEKEIIGSNNAGVLALIQPDGGNYCFGLKSVKAVIYNAGMNDITNVEVHWSVDGVAQTTNYYTGTLVPIGSAAGQFADTVTLGDVFINSAVDSLIKVWTSLPNGVADVINANDTTSQTWAAALGGTYTINSTLPTGGANFQTFEELATSLSSYGVCSPVIVDVSTAVYTEKVIFGNIPYASSVNTIRINGNGATVQFSNTTTDRQILTLNGVSYLTLDNLTFKSMSSYGWGALITNGSANDSITNCTFDLSTVTSSSSSYSNGIVFSGSTTSPSGSGFNGSDCYIGNNYILGSPTSYGPYYGIMIYGTSDGNVIENNVIENFYSIGIYIYSSNGTKILNNELHNSNKTGYFTTFTGIFKNGNTPNLEIVGNRIHHPGGVSGYTGTFRGIYLSSSNSSTEPALIANNAIYDINYNGTVMGIYMNATQYNFVYHNTVVIDQILTSANPNYGIYATGVCTNSDVKNNNVSITGGTTGAKYGFYYNATNSIGDVQKNNFYLSSSQSGDQFYGRLGTDYSSQSAFQIAFPALEVGSPTADPQFVNAVTGDFKVQNSALIGTGVDLSALVSKDINGSSRPANPTLGAFESAVVDVLDAATDTLLSAQSILCEGPHEMSIVVRNNGTVDISSLTINWEIDGVAQAPISYTQTLVASGGIGQNSDTVVLGTVPFVLNTPVTVKAWTSAPNGGVDDSTSNDEFSQTYEAVNYLPSAAGIIIDPGVNANYTLKIDNPQHVATYLWYFGDGDSTVLTGNYDINKQYPVAGTYTITVILRNGCGDDTLTSAPFFSLPVEMDRLSGDLDSDNRANLSWNTFMESNNSGFKVYRSDNGKEFDEIGFVETLAADGNSSERIGYRFRDAKVLTSQVYYRIAQVDLDGKMSYSNIISLEPTSVSTLSMTAYPNPLDNEVNIELHGQTYGKGKLYLMDALGNLLRRIDLKDSEVRLDMNGYTSGIYFLKYTDEQNSVQMKLLKR